MYCLCIVIVLCDIYVCSRLSILLVCEIISFGRGLRWHGENISDFTTSLFIDRSTVGFGALYTPQTIPSTKQYISISEAMPSFLSQESPCTRRVVWIFIFVGCLFLLGLFRFIFNAMIHRNSHDELPYEIPTFTPEPYNMPVESADFVESLRRRLPHYVTPKVPEST